MVWGEGVTFVPKKEPNNADNSKKIKKPFPTQTNDNELSACVTNDCSECNSTVGKSNKPGSFFERNPSFPYKLYGKNVTPSPSP